MRFLSQSERAEATAAMIDLVTSPHFEVTHIDMLAPSREAEESGVDPKRRVFLDTGVRIVTFIGNVKPDPPTTVSWKTTSENADDLVGMIGDLEDGG